MANIYAAASLSHKAAAASETTAIAKELPHDYALAVKGFLGDMGICTSLSENHTSRDFYAHLIRSLLKVDHLERGRVTCTLSVLPAFVNFYDGVHGGAVAAIAERVTTGCARTVVADDKELFLGELSMSYLSAATLGEVVVVEASVARSGRNITMVAAEFKIKKTGKLVYLARATFFHMPVSKL